MTVNVTVSISPFRRTIFYTILFLSSHLNGFVAYHHKRRSMRRENRLCMILGIFLSKWQPFDVLNSAVWFPRARRSRFHLSGMANMGNRKGHSAYYQQPFQRDSTHLLAFPSVQISPPLPWHLQFADACENSLKQNTGKEEQGKDIHQYRMIASIFSTCSESNTDACRLQ